MLGRLFGRGKDERSEAVCGECGRTLLAGEWTQRVTDDRGDEMVLCSLCAQAHPLAGGERLKVGNGTAATRKEPDMPDGDVTDPGQRAEPPREERRENDQLWKAIKDRDAEIERLNGQLARAEAERQELLGTVALLQEQLGAQPGEAAEVAAQVPEPVAEPEPPSVESLPFESEEPVDEMSPVDLETEGSAAVLSEDTAEISPEEAAAEGLVVGGEPVADAEPVGEATRSEEPADVEADAASLTLLQRGVDLLNVSAVPRKVAETTADLGLPGVHVAFDGRIVSATFLWTMGWYRYTVELESGAVRLDERGYEERDDLRPNGTVRGDGTVQLAPAQISRAAAQRLQQQAQPAAREEHEEPAPPPPGGPEILSKSLLGQRTDDEPPSWEQTRARDFDWD